MSDSELPTKKSKLEGGGSNGSFDTKWREVVQEIESVSGKEILLIENIPSQLDSSKITKEFILSMDHFLLDKDLCRSVMKKRDDSLKIIYGWKNGSTSCGTHIWNNVMVPDVKKGISLIEEKEWKKAFALFLGLHLFAMQETDWLADNEFYTNFDLFRKWFNDYSSGWEKLLAQTDDTLGIACKSGREEGYRPILNKILLDWETETNILIKDIFDEYAHDEKARVRIFTEEGFSDDDEEDDEDVEDEDDEDNSDDFSSDDEEDDDVEN
ncbi:uncharacterized protein LOC136075410 [Hydra vulgaris]|uniref:Uncharacterized protein LOC136075410 n=1 Tax=Hydra vulgaris TaxID=6087 RepID=A0ABM4B6S9_HYDVU